MSIFYAEFALVPDPEKGRYSAFGSTNVGEVVAALLDYHGIQWVLAPAMGERPWIGYVKLPTDDTRTARKMLEELFHGDISVFEELASPPRQADEGPIWIPTIGVQNTPPGVHRKFRKKYGR